jgi:trk system potassium uptake protein TrkH
MKNFNLRLVLKVMGSLVLIESIILLLMALVPIIFSENDSRYFLLSALISGVFAAFSLLIGRKALPTIGKREGSVIVTFTWIIFSFFGLLPFWLSGSISSFTDAFFETISGFTTTGASILDNIEELSHGMLFWRSFTHWIGGIGIIVLSLALLPVFGVSGTQLFAAESTGPTKDKIHAKISETAKRLFLIYLFLTVTESLLLRLGGMNWFDALCQSFGTIATGGFSTKQASIAYWDSPFIQYVIIIFMILSGVNFSLYYFGFKNKLAKIKENEELRYYLMLLLFFVVLITFFQIDFTKTQTFSSIEKIWRDTLFNVSSLMTTTGFTTVDYMYWKPLTWIILLVVMLTGSSAGSTSGGIKMIRVVISGKACYYQFKRLIHPNAVIPVRYNKHTVREDILTRVLTFVILYLIIAAFGVLVLAISGLGFYESIGGMIACLGGVGPGLGLVGPSGNYAYISDFSKWFLSLMMLTGRLELFTVLMIFTPAFWRK